METMEFQLLSSNWKQLEKNDKINETLFATNWILICFPLHPF